MTDNKKPAAPIGLAELEPGAYTGEGGGPRIAPAPETTAFTEGSLSEIARAPFWLISLFTGCDAWELTDAEAKRIGIVLGPLADKYLNEWAKTHQAEIIAAIAIAGVTANKAKAVRAEKEKRKQTAAANIARIESGGAVASNQAARDAEIKADLKNQGVKIE